LSNRDGYLQENDALPAQIQAPSPRWAVAERFGTRRGKGRRMSKGLIGSMNRSGVKSDKTPPVALKRKFSDPSICDRCGAVYTGKTWRRGRRIAGEMMATAKWVTCPGCEQAASGEYYGQVRIEVGDGVDRDAISARI